MRTQLSPASLAPRLHFVAFVALVILVPLVASGCGLNLRLANAAVRKPSNVALYFSIRDARGEPVPNLAAAEFQVYEDGKLVSVFESKQTILNPEVAAVHYTLLLMDMSGSVLGSGSLDQLIDAAGAFTDQVGRVQQVAVYAFDGTKEIHPISGFSVGGGRAGVAALRGFKSKDPSTNLNGAVVEALKVLDAQMQKSTQPLRFGTLVVFTDGTDHAHRLSRDELVKSLDDLGDNMNVFAIGVGGEIDESELRTIGRTGTLTSRNPAEVKGAFGKVAARVESFTKSFYLFSYCSPSRAGQHDVRVVAAPKDRAHGSLDYHFDATGFGPECDPNSHPAFDVKRPNLHATPAR